MNISRMTSLAAVAALGLFARLAVAQDWLPGSVTVTYTYSCVSTDPFLPSAQATGAKSMSYGGSVATNNFMAYDSLGNLVPGSSSHNVGYWMLSVKVVWEVLWNGAGPMPQTVAATADINENQGTMFKRVYVRYNPGYGSGYAQGVGSGLTTGSALYYNWTNPTGFMPPLNLAGQTLGMPLQFQQQNGHMISTELFGVQQNVTTDAQAAWMPSNAASAYAHAFLGGTIELKTCGGQPI